MFELVENTAQSAVIKVIGIGGGGGNAVKHMIANGVDGVDFICANTDAQALESIDSRTVLQLGGSITKGLGAGANPDVGRAAALEDRERIADALRGADMVFITAGMGGGTGTGGAPVVAEVARELGVLTVAVVTRPFPFEGKKRAKIALEGLHELQQHVDSLITIPNERLLEVLGKGTSLIEAFNQANDVLLGAVQGIADLIIRPGMINVDFADVRTVMSEMGMAMMGTGSARGENRAREAAEKAINSPLLDNIDLQGARGILVNITAGVDLSLGEFSEVGDIIEEFASDEATVVVGTVIDPQMSDEIKVTVVATGLGGVAVERAPLTVVEAAPRSERPLEQRKQPTPAYGNNYAGLDSPAYSRHKAEARQEPAPEAPPAARPRAAAVGGNAAVAIASDPDMDYFDIPAFLRRQAD